MSEKDKVRKATRQTVIVKKKGGQGEITTTINFDSVKKHGNKKSTINKNNVNENIKAL